MIVELTVVPKSGRFRLSLKEGMLKAYLKSPPEKNRANLELIKELSRLLGCSVRLISGEKTRRKTIEADIAEKEWESFLASI